MRGARCPPAVTFGLLMTRRTPQQKKWLAYLRDGRNAYGENSKGSRKSILFGAFAEDFGDQGTVRRLKRMAQATGRWAQITAAPRAGIAAALVWGGVLAFQGCRPGPSPAAAAPAVEVARDRDTEANSAGEAPAPARARQEAWRCGVSPMKLVLSDFRQAVPEPIVMMQMSADGELVLPAFMSRPFGRLGEDGCLVSQNRVVLELTPSGKLWTGRELMHANGDRLESGATTFTLRDDGTLTRDAPGEAVQTWARLEGYRPEARCTAFVMLATLMTMMPSMAVSDGAAPWLQPPADSLCAEREHERHPGAD